MSEISDKVLKVTIDYIGPSSEKFLERQASAHLGGLSFSNMQREHLPEMVKWVTTSAGLLIGKDKAAELAGKLSKI